MNWPCRQAAGTWVVGWIVGDDRSTGGHYGTEQGFQIMKLQSIHNVCIVKFLPTLVPGNIGDGLSFKIGFAAVVIEHLTDKSVFAFGNVQDVF